MIPAHLAALSALLLRPDDASLAGRGHHQTVAGDPDRRVTVLGPVLMAWLQHRHMDRDGEYPCQPAKRAKETWRVPLTFKAAQR